MSNKSVKPKHSSHELIEMMRAEKGITFHLISEADAEAYLLNTNNYLRTASYRKNYQKYQRGPEAGKYIDLDFEYLRELSAIDLQFRHVVSALCLDIEHDLKVTLLRDIENDATEDGYTIVKSFLDANPKIVKAIAATSSSAYTKDLIKKYMSISVTENPVTKEKTTTITNYSDCPVWVFLEFITFGEFIRFYEFYYQSSTLTHLPRQILSSVKSLRNGCAHNNCMLNNIANGQSQPSLLISKQVGNIPSITGSLRRKYLSYRIVLEFVSLLYAYKFSTQSNNGHKSLNSCMELLLKRMPLHKEYFKNNLLITGTYSFILAVAQYLFPDEYTAATKTADFDDV